MKLPMKVLFHTYVVNADELLDEQEYEDIYNDMKDECRKHGVITKLVIPHPKSNREEVPGLGKVFVEFVDTQSSVKVRESLHRRTFRDNVVVAIYYPKGKFCVGQYGD